MCVCVCVCKFSSAAVTARRYQVVRAGVFLLVVSAAVAAVTCPNELQQGRN